MTKTALADTVLSALGALLPAERAQAEAFVLKFAENPKLPGNSLERIAEAHSKDVWSARISRDLRAVLYKDGEEWVLVYVGHHDDAYDWAKRRTIERNRFTGVLQLLEVRESIKEVERVVERIRYEDPPLFRSHDDKYLLSLGVPPDFLPVLRNVREEEGLLAVCEHLPQDVAERLLDLAEGRPVLPPERLLPGLPVTASADAQRHFFVPDDEHELRAALEAPLERWIAFLHPSQRAMVDAAFSGPALVTGSAGTGKTVVAMHRARFMARQKHQVLLTSYVSTLCDNVERNQKLFCTADELRRIRVATIHSTAAQLLKKARIVARVPDSKEMEKFLDAIAKGAPKFPPAFVRSEWEHVIEAQGIGSWEEYREAKRTGRGTALSVKERQELWAVFGPFLDSLAKQGLSTWSQVCTRARQAVESHQVEVPWDAIIVDEVQDLKPAELRLVRALAEGKLERLMLVGDAGQRIYAGGFSLRALGIEVRGRSKVLRINYRTTQEIRRTADRLLGSTTEDLDQGMPARRGTLSLVRGPQPVLEGFPSEAAEFARVVETIRAWVKAGLPQEAIGVFARSNACVERVADALTAAGIPVSPVAERGQPAPGVRVGTMHRAKGLEFRAVVVVGACDGQLPNLVAVNAAEEPADREDALRRERNLLYVAMTRAREFLTITWHGGPSPFLKELQS